VLFCQPSPTRFDLCFRLFGTDVRVHPLFWLIAVLLGWNLTLRPLLPGNGLGDLAVWVMVCFVSILLHEFGHIWMGQVFGSHGHILLYGMGGLAIGSTASRPWQRILIYAAGPGMQLLLFAALHVALFVYPVVSPDTPKAVLLLLLLLWQVNLYWPLLNLLPIWPLDGGQIVREICVSASHQRGTLISLWISLIVAAALAINAFLAEGRTGRGFLPWWVPVGMYIGIFFTLFAVGSWQGIQAEQERRRQHYSDELLPWER
jgi:stage IV sporulation protein FB